MGTFRRSSRFFTTISLLPPPQPPPPPLRRPPLLQPLPCLSTSWTEVSFSLCETSTRTLPLQMRTSSTTVNRCQNTLHALSTWTGLVTAQEAPLRLDYFAALVSNCRIARVKRPTSTNQHVHHVELNHLSLLGSLIHIYLRANHAALTPRRSLSSS